MGDIDGTAVAQVTHEAILKSEGCLISHSLMRYGSPIPTGPLWEGAYLDDHLIALIIDKIHSHCHDNRTCDECMALKRIWPDEECIHASRKAYDAARCPTNSTKAYRFAKRFLAGGTSVNSDYGKVCASLDKACQIARFFAGSIRLEYWSLAPMQPIIGCLGFILGHRRYLTCILHEWYTLMNSQTSAQLFGLPFHLREMNGRLLSFCYL